MWRSVRIEGSATPIIETSRASRNRAPQRTSRVPQARLVRRSEPVSGIANACVGADTDQLLARRGVTRARCKPEPDRLLFDRYLTDMFDAGQTRVVSHDLQHPELADVELPSLLHALSDPVRLEIV